VLTQIGEERNIITAIKKRRWETIGHVLRYGEELHHIIIERSTKGRKTAGRPRNSYVSKLKKDAWVNIYVELKRLAEHREEWKTRLCVVSQPKRSNTKTKKIYIYK